MKGSGRNVQSYGGLGEDTLLPPACRRITILRHAQIDVTMNVYTEVSDAKTLKALQRLGRQLGS